MVPGGLGLTVQTTDNSDNELGGSYAEKDDNEHSLLVYRDHTH